MNHPNKCDVSVYVLSHSVMFNSAIPWTVALQAPLFMGFSRQKLWGWLSFPPPRNLPNPGIEPMSDICHALTSWFFTTSATWEA